MKNSDVTRRRISFYGEVQAVGFRYVAREAALRFGVTGWVRNEYDGSVTMEIQGTPFQISQVLMAIDRARYIRVERTESRDLAPDENERTFRVRY